MSGDDKVVKIVSQLGLDTSPAIKSLKDLATETKQSGDKVIREAQRIAKESAQAWKQKASQDATLAREQGQMWKQLDRERVAADKDRLRHGLSVERSLTTEAKKRAQAELAHLRDYTAAYNATRKEAAQQLAARQSAANSLPNLGAQLSGVQARMRVGGVGNFELQAQAAVMRSQVQLLTERLRIEGRLTKEEAAQVVELKKQAAQMNSNVSTLASDKQQQARRPGSNMLVQGALGYAGVRALQANFADVGDIEARMTSLARIIEDPTFQLDKMRETIFALGQEYGQSFQTVQDVMLRWAQAGYNVADSITATRSSLLAVNTAELDASQATESMVGILKQWGLEASDLTGILDKVNKVSDDYSVSSQDIIEGLLRSSSAARNANVTFEETVALLTAMGESSGRSGANAGNALNSVISYMSRDKFLETLEGSGIGAFADATNKKLRPTFDILEALAKNWDGLQGDVQASLMEQAEAAGLFSEEIASAGAAQAEWNDVQKRDLTQDAAGTYRRNYLLALLKNFGQVYEVLKTQQDSFGYSERENARTMQNAQAKVQSLKTAFQELSYSIAQDGGLLDSFKRAVDLGKGLVNWFNDLPPATRQAVIVIAELAAGMAALNFGFQQVSGRSFVGLLESIYGGIVKIKATGGMASAIGGIATAAGPLLLIAAALGILTVAIVKTNNEALRLQNQFEETKRKSDEFIRQSETEAKQHGQNALMVAKLADEYAALEKQRKGADDETLTAIASKQEQVTQRIEEALGKETAARLKAAGYSKDAADTVAKAEKEKASVIDQVVQAQIQSYEDDLRAQVQAASKSIQLIEAQMNGWESYLTFGEHVKLAFASVWAYIREGWYNVLSSVKEVQYDMATGLAKFFDMVGMDGVAKKYYAAAGDRMSEAYEYSAKSRFGIPKELAETERRISEGPLARQRKLLADLRGEIDKVSQTVLDKGKPPATITTGDDEGDGTGTGNGEFGTGDAGKSADDKRGERDDARRRIIDGITEETEAVGKLNAVTEQQIALLQARITHNAREGATLEELNQADRDRADLAGMLTERQAKLHVQAEAARSAYATLADLQGKVNRSTDEGAQAYDDITGAMERMQGVAGSNATEWWDVQREKTELLKANNAATVDMTHRLDDLKGMYDEGLMSLEQYLFALRQLEHVTGLSAQATKALNAEQERAFTRKWQDDIAAALKARQAEIQATIAILDDALAKFDDHSAAGDRDKARAALSKAFGTLQGVTMNVAMPGMGDVRSLVQNALDAFASADLGALDPEAFAATMGADLASLRGFASSAQAYLEGVGAATEARLKSINRELKAIDDDLKQTLDDLQGELDALDEQQQKDDRGKATTEHGARKQTLQEQIDWYAMKGTDKYAAEIAALRKQIADEETAWADTQGQWRKEDKRAELQAQMEDARKEADLRKQTLESEREALQEQQRVMSEALNAMLAYINSEIAARKEALETQKKELQDTSAGIDEQLKGVDDKVVTALARMASQGDEAYDNAQSLINNIIAGIKSRQAALQSAVNAINNTIDNINTVGSGGGDPTTTTPTTTTGGGGAPGGGGGGGSRGAHAFAEGGFVKGGRGGALGIFGEGAPYSGDEVVFTRQHAVPMLSQAMATVMRNGGGGNYAPTFTPAELAQAVGAEVRRAMSGVVFTGDLDIRLPDGVVERRIIRAFASFEHDVRGAGTGLR